MPRIITGAYRGRKLRTTHGNEMRPTLDRVKESMFNMIVAWCPGARVLDLFAGCGSLGLEALSRGAASVLLVDSSHRMCRVALENVELLDASDRVQVMHRDAKAALRQEIADGGRFDLVFADPPYNSGLVSRLLDIVVDDPPLVEDGLMIVEHHKFEAVPATVGSLSRWRQREFGDTVVSILRCDATPAEGNPPSAPAGDIDANEDDR